MPPKRLVKKPNVAPKLSSINERTRLDRLKTMDDTHHFTTSVIGEIARYDELRRFGSIGAILTGVYYINYESEYRNSGVRIVEADFVHYGKRAAVDRLSLITLEREVKRVHLPQSEFLRRISETRLGLAIVVRDMDLEAAVRGTAGFNPVGDSLHRGNTYLESNVNADPYTTIQSDPVVQSHVAEVITGLSVEQITDRIGIAMTVQENRHTYWQHVLDEHQRQGEARDDQ